MYVVSLMESLEVIQYGDISIVHNTTFSVNQIYFHRPIAGPVGGGGGGGLYM